MKAKNGGRPLLVTAHLATPIGGDLPHLDALLEFEKAQHLGLERVDRNRPAPPPGEIKIPLLRRKVCGIDVACCSAPIASDVASESVEHFTSRFPVEHASMLREDERTVIAVGNATYKSYRLPLRVRLMDRVCWFCVGNRRGILSLLKNVRSLSKKRSYGYGRVEKWTAEPVEHDLSWWCPTERGRVLMRPLPAGALQEDAIGYRTSFGACQPPYWHPDRYMEVIDSA